MTYNNTLFSTNKESEGAQCEPTTIHLCVCSFWIGQTCPGAGRAANSVSRGKTAHSATIQQENGRNFSFGFQKIFLKFSTFVDTKLIAMQWRDNLWDGRPILPKPLSDLPIYKGSPLLQYLTMDGKSTSGLRETKSCNTLSNNTLSHCHTLSNQTNQSSNAQLAGKTTPGLRDLQSKDLFDSNHLQQERFETNCTLQF